MATARALGRLGAALRRIGHDLDALGAPWALVGGLAVGARSEPRFTRDVDLAVSIRGDRDAERLIFELQARGYRPLALVEHEAQKRLATVRLVHAGEAEGGIVLDLLVASSGVEGEVVKAASAIEVLPGLTAKVALRGHLLALKVLSYDPVRRPQDLTDINALLEGIGATEMRRARAALGLRMARGDSLTRQLKLIQLLDERRELVVCSAIRFCPHSSPPSPIVEGVD